MPTQEDKKLDISRLRKGQGSQADRTWHYPANHVVRQKKKKKICLKKKKNKAAVGP